MNCNYHIGRLKPFVYLIKDLVYKMRDYKAYIVSGEIYKLEADLVTLRESETYSGRFKFLTDVNVTFTSMMDDTFIRENQFHLVVEDGTGMQFLVSPEFVAKYTSELTIDDKLTTQTLTFTTLSNIPTRIVGSTIAPISVTHKECRYNTIGVDKLWIDVDGDWEIINFLECEYSKVFDGTKISTQIEFTIPIEDNDWHYNLISFPNNRWNMKLESDQETILSNNMFPQYTRQTAEQPTATDKFTIVMKGIDIGSPLTIDYNDTPTRWVSSNIAYGELQYICIEFDKYVKEVKQVYEEDEWKNTSEIRAGALIQKNSVDCGYQGEGYLYKWSEVPDEYICIGTSKYQKQRLYYSSNNGETWEATDQIREGSLIEVNSVDCDYHNIEWKWDGGYICEEQDELETWVLLDTYICEIVTI